MLKKKNKRKFLITDEPMFIHPSLLGIPLASPVRRAFAFITDFIIFSLIIGIIAMVILHSQAPGIVPNITKIIFEKSEEKRSALSREITLELFRFFDKKKPAFLPPEIKTALYSGNSDRIDDVIINPNYMLTTNLISRLESEFNTESRMIVIRGDILFGKWNPVIGGFTLFLAYFTLLTWALRGQTPGKLSSKIRVIRLDGKSLSLWGSFGRAAGYSASFSTFFLGFLEMLCHPNRQTVHDRISSTVVIRALTK